MRYTVYKVTNLVNGKIYIGKHQTTDLNDQYLGSGVALRRAIIKYGRDKFTKEILHNCSSEFEMNSLEREIVDEQFVARSDTYNTGIGGEGGPHFKGKKHTDDSKRRISETCKSSKQPVSQARRTANSKLHLGRKKSAEEIQNISRAKKGKIGITDGSKRRYVNQTEIPLGWYPIKFNSRVEKIRSISLGS